MKITLAPLVVDARGRFGGIVFSNWKGIPVAREFVPPSQPRTASQVDIRNIFRNANSLYRRASSISLSHGGLIESYARAAYGQPLIARNVLIGLMADMLRSKNSLADLPITFPNPRAPAPSTVAASHSSSTTTVNVTSVAPPTGLDLEGVGAYIIIDSDPETDASAEIALMQGSQHTSSTPGLGAITFSDLPNGNYRAFGWASYTDDRYPTTDPRYREISASLSDTVTVS